MNEPSPGPVRPPSRSMLWVCTGVHLLASVALYYPCAYLALGAVFVDVGEVGTAVLWSVLVVALGWAPVVGAVGLVRTARSRTTRLGRWLLVAWGGSLVALLVVAAVLQAHVHDPPYDPMGMPAPVVTR